MRVDWSIKKLQVGEVEEGTLIFRRTVDEKFLVAGVTDVSCAGKSAMFGLLVVLLPVNVYSTSSERACGQEHLAKNRKTLSLPVIETQLTPG